MASDSAVMMGACIQAAATALAGNQRITTPDNAEHILVLARQIFEKATGTAYRIESTS